jgi:hypothetical protein
MKLTTGLYLVPRLRLSGAIPPLPQFVFMVSQCGKTDLNNTFAISPVLQIRKVWILHEECNSSCSLDTFVYSLVDDERKNKSV